MITRNWRITRTTESRRFSFSFSSCSFSDKMCFSHLQAKCHEQSDGELVTDFASCTASVSTSFFSAGESFESRLPELGRRVCSLHTRSPVKCCFLPLITHAKDSSESFFSISTSPFSLFFRSLSRNRTSERKDSTSCADSDVL